jgi:predicted ArsR family transcriptional regulator
MMSARLEAEMTALAALAEPVRRRLYLYVVERGELSREQAARGLRISRALAAFHLDKLLEQGLLAVRYRRLTGRSGRGAGRPAKLYRRSPREVRVMLPERRYDVVARLLAQALVAGRAPRSLAALRRAARRFGREVGAAGRASLAGRPTQARLLQHAEAALRDYGFEPIRTGDGLRLRNCPFDAVARDHRALVCGANLCVMEGLVAGLGILGIRAQLDPQPGQCCVAFRPRRKSSTGRPPTAEH